ncbi:MAG: HNH endonuclease [Solirubrobacteraceae bacterium]
MPGSPTQSATAGPTEILARLARFDPQRDYYALSLLAHEEDRPGWSAYTQYAGPSPTRRGWELREAALVDPTAMTALWGDQGWLTVERPGTLGLWVRLGGHALVAPELARQRLASMLAPQECAPDGAIGYVRSEGLRPCETGRRPPRSTRRRILRRDNFRCRRCGAGGTGVELSRHHVVPHSQGGLSRERDLITLCQDCHDHLHEGPQLWEYALEQAFARLPRDNHHAHRRRYRAAMTRRREPGER